MNKWQFKEISATSELFFELLPDDWRSEVAPVWPQLCASTQIYGVFEQTQIIAGGIVFAEVSPDMQYAASYARQWHQQGYKYIGFVWVHPLFRGLKIGSFWLRQLFVNQPRQKFWLTVEEHGLIDFYQKNGFTLQQALQNADTTEWVLKYEP